jgi:hypothetical protein
MKEAILPIIFMSISMLVLAGCSNNKINEDFKNKKECAPYIAAFQKSIEKPEITSSKITTVDNFEVFFSKTLNTCIGTYVFTSIYEDKYEADKQKLVIKDLLTGQNIYDQSFYLRIPGMTTINMDASSTKTEFLRKIDELKK